MRFLTLALSYKDKGLCVAGIDYDTLRFVRLGKSVSTCDDCLPLTERDIKFSDRTLRIMDLIDVDVTKMRSFGCQTENYRLLKINSFIKKLSISEIADLYTKLEHTPYIFFDNNKTLSSQVADLNSSIGFFKISDLKIYVNKNEHNTPKYRSYFIYNNNHYSDLSTTDSAICDYPHTLYRGKPIADDNDPIKRLGDAFIMVTLPPRPWEETNSYFKFVSGVIIDDRALCDIESNQTNARAISAGDTVLLEFEDRTEEVRIGTNSVKSSPTWTGEYGQRVGYKTELFLGGNPLDGFISTESPLAKALLGKSVGSEFSYDINGNKICGKILEIK